MRIWRNKVRTETIVKTAKAKDLTLAQVKTLHRLRGGTEYKMRADGKKGGEVTNQSFALLSAPSIPVLHRLGLVDFTQGRPKGASDQGKFFPVSLTDSGWATLKEFDEATRGGA